MTPLGLEHLCFERGGRDLLGRVKPLWEQLNRHHLQKSNHFKHHYAALTFDMRCRKFGEDSDLQVCIDLVRDLNSARDAGYCLVSLTPTGMGEIGSLFIEPAYRRLGLGDQLMRRAVGWLRENGANTIHLAVAKGNEAVFEFYASHGFRVRKTILEFVPEQDIPLEGTCQP